MNEEAAIPKTQTWLQLEIRRGISGDFEGSFEISLDLVMGTVITKLLHPNINLDNGQVSISCNSPLVIQILSPNLQSR
jgi:hypothetical protein